jgi:glycine betaine/proline transport system substrate-binding protein
MAIHLVMESRPARWRAGAAGLAVLGLALTGCGGAKVGASDSGSGSSGDGAAKCGTFNLAINDWVGYEADAAVVGYVAEKKLGCTVKRKNLKEQVAWQGFGTGEVDAVLENWGHDELKKKYIAGQKTAVEAGETGNRGVIGWYVPPWMAQKYPDITHHRLEEPQQVRVAVQDVGVGRQGAGAGR